MTKVKICGIKSMQDAKIAIKYGADYLGFIIDVDYSKDSLKKENAKLLMDQIYAKKVMVTVKEDVSGIVKLYKYLKPDVIQISSPLSLKQIMKLKKEVDAKISYTIHVSGEESIDEAEKYSEFADFILLDSKAKGKAGGTGKTHNWDTSKEIVGILDTPVFLAGGLKVYNIERAVSIVEPYGVDVNSGVKSENKKDEDKVKEFIDKAK